MPYLYTVESEPKRRFRWRTLRREYGQYVCCLALFTATGGVFLGRYWEWEKK